MEQKEYERVFSCFYPGLMRYINQVVVNQKDAENIALETLMKAWCIKYDLGGELAINNFLCMHARHAVNNYSRTSKKTINPLEIAFGNIEKLKEDQCDKQVMQKLYDTIEAFPRRLKQVVKLSMQGLKTPQIAGIVGISRQNVNNLKSNAYKFIRELNSHSTQASDNILEQVCVIRDEICEELIKYLARHPNKLYDLDPYKFERLVAELIRDMGYDVHITPRTRDGGKDIVAVLKTPSNDKIVTIVECKRYRADRPIDISIVRSFLNIIRDQDRVNAGWIVTTSTFSADVIEKQKEFKWLLSLKDSKNLETWCRNYGQWKQSGGSGGLWLPNNPLTV